MTAKPTTFPHSAPSSHRPTAAPSITGLVAIFSVEDPSITPESTITDADIAEIENVIVNGFNISHGSISTNRNIHKLFLQDSNSMRD